MRFAWSALLLAACGFPQPADVLPPPVDAFVEPIDAPGTMMAVPTSCAGGLAKTCGSAGTDQCCTSPKVTGDTYFRSFDVAAGTTFNDMTHPATVNDFRLDKYEVTVGRFRAFVTANQGTQAMPPASGAGAHDNIAGSGWQTSDNGMLTANTTALTAALKCDTQFGTWSDTAGSNETRPINCVTWFEAMAFCAYDAGFLPTEAEWNFAAAGGSMQRAEPWSSPPSSTSVNATFASFKDTSGACNGDGNSACAVTDLIDVGTKPAGDGAFGQSDLGGNVDEWVLDAYATAYGDPCVNCADLTLTTAGRVQRGGSFFTDPSNMRTGARGMTNPTSRDPFSGIRCARKL